MKKNVAILGISILLVAAFFGIRALLEEHAATQQIIASCENTGGTYADDTCACPSVLPEFNTSTQGCQDAFGNTVTSKEAFRMYERQFTFTTNCRKSGLEPYVVPDTNLTFCHDTAWGGAKVTTSDTDTTVQFPSAAGESAVLVYFAPDAIEPLAAYGILLDGASVQSSSSLEGLAADAGVSVGSITEISLEDSVFSKIFQIQTAGTVISLIPEAHDGHHLAIVAPTRLFELASWESFFSSIWFDTAFAL